MRAEAVALADRVLVLEDGRATLDAPVALVRPRLHGAAAFAQLEGRLLAHLLNRPPTEAPRLVA